MKNITTIILLCFFTLTNAQIIDSTNQVWCELASGNEIYIGLNVSFIIHNSKEFTFYTPSAAGITFIADHEKKKFYARASKPLANSKVSLNRRGGGKAEFELPFTVLPLPNPTLKILSKKVEIFRFQNWPIWKVWNVIS